MRTFGVRPVRIASRRLADENPLLVGRNLACCAGAVFWWEKPGLLELAGLTRRGRFMHPVITASDCIGCGACIDACPAGVIELQDNVCTVVNEGDCIGCANCQDECPVGAITEIAE